MTESREGLGRRRHEVMLRARSRYLLEIGSLLNHGVGCWSIMQILARDMAMKFELFMIIIFSDFSSNNVFRRKNDKRNRILNHYSLFITLAV